MKKAFVLISAAALCAALAGCSSDSAQNNLSKAIDDVERDWDAGVDYMERSMDNMDNTDRNNSGYGVTSRDNLSTSGFYYGDGSGYMGYYDNGYYNTEAQR